MTLLQESLHVESSQQLPQSLYDFFAGIKESYTMRDVDPNGNEIPLLTEEGHLDIELLKKRSEVFIQINKDIFTRINNKFGSDSVEAHATEITLLLTEPINNLFINVIEDKQQKKNSLSWIDCDGGKENIQRMQHIIQDILKPDSKFASYFEECPESKRILTIFAFELPYTRSFEKRISLIEEIDDLSEKLYQRGLPTWIVTESTYYTDMYPQEHDDHWIPEPTLRLVYPVEDRSRLDVYHKEVWKKLCDEHGVQKQEPRVYMGQQMITTGSDIPSLSTAEWTTNKSIIYLLGSFKVVPLIKEVAKYSDISITDEEIATALLEIYLWHENGHAFYNLLDRTWEELDTDLTTLVGVLAFNKNSKAQREHIMLCLFCEYAKQAFQPPLEAVVPDGYRKSGVYILSVLFNQRFITFTENGFKIHGENELDYKKILEDHAGIHSMNQEILERLARQLS